MEPAPDARRATVAVVLLALVAGALAAALWTLGHREHGRTPVARAASAPGEVPAALAVLRAWDERRSAAWAAGDPAALRALYTRDSRAGRADVAMLRRWLGRGLSVEGLRTQVLSAELRARSADRLVLVVSDRVSGGTAVGRTRLLALPRDLPTTHTVTLVRERGRWLVAEVA